MILFKEDIHLFPESPILEGRIGKFFQIADYPSTKRVAVYITDTGQVVFIGVDDAGTVSISPQVSGAS